MAKLRVLLEGFYAIKIDFGGIIGYFGHENNSSYDN